MRTALYITAILPVCLLLIGVVPARAQVQLSDSLFLSNANANLSGGYSGGFGNLTESSHSLNWSGTGAVNGYYYNPQFLSFTIQPYYNQSRVNSSSASVGDSSGINLSTSLFGGSQFPGTISYSKNYNTLETVGIPGLPGYSANGNNDALGIGWGLNFSGLPHIGVQFQLSHNAYSIFGTDAEGTSAAKSFAVQSSYKLAGFNFSGAFNHIGMNGEVPLVLTNEGTASNHNSGNNFNFNATHRLPMNGSFSASFSRSSSSSDSTPGGYSGPSLSDIAGQSMSANGGINPWKSVSIAGSINYDDNLGGTIRQTLVNQGGLYQETRFVSGATALGMVGTVAYQPVASLSLSGQVQRREQNWLGMQMALTSFSGISRYMHNLLGGVLAASATVTESHSDNEPGGVLGFSDSLSYSRDFAGWHVSGSANYVQNEQSVLITYMTSNYSFGGNARRRIGPFYWTAGASTARTGMAMQRGSGASSESYSTGLSLSPWFAISANYGNSLGTAVQSTTGLIIAPLPLEVLNPFAIVTYGGNSYSIAASTTPIHRFAFGVSYSRAASSTSGGLVSSNNLNRQLLITTHYQWRQMYFSGGYSNFYQGISIAGVPASQSTSFFVGVSRWFNFF